MRRRRKLRGGTPAVVVVALCATAGAALAGTTGELSFVGAKIEGQGGVDGIAEPDDVAVSRDGQSVYAVGGGDDAIATFKRNDQTGKLQFLNAKFDGQGGVSEMAGPIDVAASPDGRNVYVTSSTDDSIVTFKRDRHTGKLRFLNAKVDGHGGVDGLDGAYAVVVSGDGRNVYVTGDDDDAIAAFKRNRHTGRLKFLQAKFNGQGGVEGIAAPDGMVAGAGNVYVAGSDDNAIATFTRNDQTGKLQFVNAKFDGQGGVDGLGGAYEPTVSRDARNVYVASYLDDAIATFKRKGQTGRLEFVNAKFNGQGGVENLNEPLDVVVSKDGRNVYAAVYNDGAGGSSLDTFKRNRQTGKLKFKDAEVDGVGGVTDVAGIWRVAITRDDRNLYVAAYDQPSVGIFKRHP